MTSFVNNVKSFFQLFWTPDIIIHDLVNFYKPEILNQVGALEIFADGTVYYKVRYPLSLTHKIILMLEIATLWIWSVIEAYSQSKKKSTTNITTMSLKGGVSKVSIVGP